MVDAFVNNLMRLSELLKRSESFLPVFNRSPLPFECPVRIDNSRVHGKGVFATRDIKEGEIVTFYPCDLYMSDTDATRTYWRIGDCDRGRVMELATNGDYTYGGTIIGLPEKTEHPWFLGHMVNDGALITSRTRGKLAKQGIVYTRCSMARQNTVFKEYTISGTICTVGLQATRDIKSGEELFVCYGAPYWLSKYHGRIDTDRLFTDMSRIMMNV